ncbi:ATP-binding protein [Devosia sp.]|uniref:sensor histidine kinase n=1 Tax=Devosia sp. TaxID=1871048 RepID=UPI0025E915AD|nr:ATP-binding protein [Devosia sp.]MCR6636364.1 ATP-binding protein [Devosia sp.]
MKWFWIWWLGLALLGTAGLGFYRQGSLLGELEQAGSTLAAEAAQRADQHDAHLTALSAIAQADKTDSSAFLEVATTILRFYPRIDEIQLVPLDDAAPVAGTRPLEPNLAEAAKAAAKASTGQTALLTTPDRPDHYLMVKRSPNSDAARDGLMLAVDAAQLLASDAAFWSNGNATLRLTMPDGHVVYGPAEMPAPQFSRRLGSATQPLLLEASMPVSLGQLLPFDRLAAIVLGAGLLAAIGSALVQQRTRTRLAERRAELSDMESRLAHASRVNAMGEMASGMAHELTQPLTAILAQAQAGKHLLARQDNAALGKVLDDTVGQARRAADILERLRNWSRPQRPVATPVDLGAAVRSVITLLEGEAAQRAVIVQPHVPAKPISVLADPVELEQVIFNLLRNAFEAVSDQSKPGEARIVLSETDGLARLDIVDNGPGVPSELVPKLFTPFTTTRPEGTGLGLALSQRLIERAGGEIAYVPQDRGALFRVTLPLAKGGAKA